MRILYSSSSSKPAFFEEEDEEENEDEPKTSPVLIAPGARRGAQLIPNSEIEARATVVGSARCDDLARGQRAKGMGLDGGNASKHSAPATARGQRSALTLPTARSAPGGRGESPTARTE